MHWYFIFMSSFSSNFEKPLNYRRNSFQKDPYIAPPFFYPSWIIFTNFLKVLNT